MAQRSKFLCRSKAQRNFGNRKRVRGETPYTLKKKTSDNKHGLYLCLFFKIIFEIFKKLLTLTLGDNI